MEAVEQCLPSWDLDGMRFVRSKVDLQVMLDESVHTPIDAAKACKIDAADIINIKLMKCGGLYPAEKINAIARQTMYSAWWAACWRPRWPLLPV